jgi:polyisoprenoid-binding protein YceI
MKFRAKQLLSFVTIPFFVFFAAVLLSAMPRHATPQPAVGELTLNVDPAQSSVHWVLDTTLHTVHGTFSAKGGTLHLDLPTGKAEGEIVVLATSGGSGNGARDRKMHNEVLESGRFPDVVFRPERVEGKLATEGGSDLQLHGKFVLHGIEHELVIPVHAQLSGDHWSGSAKFSIPFVEWGLKDPSNFLLKVKHQVEIELELKGKLESSSVVAKS